MVPEILVTDENAPLFDLDWLNSCTQEVSLSDGGIDQFLSEVNKTLAHRIRGEFSNKYRQQALFELLGQDYTKIHFPHHEYSPELLRPPQFPPKKREELMAELRTLLDDEVINSLDELGYPPDIADYQKENELKEFLDSIRTIFKSGCDKQVQSMTSENVKKRSNSIEEDVISLVSQMSGDEMYDMPEKLDKLDFQRSDVVGEAICALTLHNQEAKMSLLKNFRQSCLMFPNPLRKFIWEGFIGDNDERDTGKKKSKRRATKDFKAEIKKKLKGGTQRAVQSSDYKKIYSAVIDTYHNNNVLRPYAEDIHMLQTANIINIINVVDKEYTTAQIYWALPFQILYEKGVESKEDEEKSMIEISCMLERFCRHALLSFRTVSKVTDKVIKLIKDDEECYKSVTEALDTSIHAAGMLYCIVPEILVADHPNKSEKVWSDLRKKKKKDWKPRDHELFGKLDLWIRKWICEGFVGILPHPLIFFIWDVLFMYEWEQQVFVTISMMIFCLIKPWILQAKNNRDMVNVLLTEPSNLYIQDVRKALLLLQNEGCLEGKEISLDLQNQITELNTNVVKEKKPEEPVEEPPPPEEEQPVVEEEPAAEEPAEGEEAPVDEEPVKEEAEEAQPAPPEPEPEPEKVEEEATGDQ